jgi:hypothetical protein
MSSLQDVTVLFEPEPPVPFFEEREREGLKCYFFLLVLEELSHADGNI